MNRYLAFIRGVRLKGLEPSRLAAPDPKSGASTNFATSANVVQRYEFSHLSPKYSEEKILKAMRGDGRMVGLDVWKRTKSREAGMWGLKPLRGTASGIKPENYFQFYLHSRPRWSASHPTHIPRRPKKKPLRGKKVGFAEKKLRLHQSY